MKTSLLLLYICTVHIVSEELVYTFSIHFFVSHSNSNLKGKQLEWDESKQREKLPMRGKGKGGTHEGNIEKEITVTSSLNTEGKTPHEREGKRGVAHLRETSRRRITVTSSLNTEGKTPHVREGKGGHT